MLNPTRRWRRHTLWLAFLAVLVPLGVLLALQYRTLRRLQEVSTVAQEAVLGNYSDAILADVRYFYLTRAERTLNVPASSLEQGRRDEIAALWGRAPLDGARRLFLLDRGRDVEGELAVFDPATEAFVDTADASESMAIVGALSRAATSLLGTTPQAGARLRVDEHDPANRMILNAILDTDGRPVGVAGLIIDEEYFKHTLLPSAVQNSLPAYFPDATKNDLLVRVRDSAGQVVMGTRRTRVEGDPLTQSFGLVFQDWTLEIQGGSPAFVKMAETNFRLLLSLSLLVAAALLLALAVALRAAGRSLQLSEMKSDFVSNVSHELRTPVASIRVFAELLRRGRAREPEKVREYGAAIESETRRLSDLIDNVLDFARIESGAKQYRRVPSDIAALTGAIVDAFRVRLLDSGWELDYPPPNGSFPPVLLDPDALSLALNNLLDNAVKYGGDSRRVYLRLVPEGGSVKISVRDEGIGIPESEQEKIFERFHRVGTGLVHDVKGSGLGLAIVHHIMQAHQGRVSVTSAQGEGSTFSLHFPAAAAHPATGAEPAEWTARRAPAVPPEPRVERG
jgi:signal transduction histidine kinase/HAMP domain-containing protein